MAAESSDNSISPSSLFFSNDGITWLQVSATNPLPTTSGGGGGGGTTTIIGPLGSQASSTSVAVTLPTDQTQSHGGVVGLGTYILDPASGSPIVYNVPDNVCGPTANGSAAANPPVLIGGTVDGTGTGNVENWKVSTGGVGSVLVASALPAGTNVIGHVIADSGSTTTVTGNVTAVQATGTNLHTVVDSGTITAVTAITNALPAGTNVIGHVIADSGSTTAVTGNVTVVQATGTNLHAVLDSTSTTAVTQATAANLLASVGGLAANGASVSGNPVLVGGRGSTATPSAVTDGQAVDWQMSKTGRGLTIPALRTNLGIQETTITSSTAETTVVTAVASTFNDIYGLTVTNSSATATKVTLKDSTGGTTRWVGYIPAGDMRGFMLEAGSAIPQATVNTNWTLTCGTSVASIDVSVFFVANV